jgi:hypothetical protein
MTGAELATIIGIVASFATCLDFATKVYNREKNKRLAAKILVESAEQLLHTLQGGHTAIETALERLRGAGHIFGGNNGVYSTGPST